VILAVQGLYKSFGGLTAVTNCTFGLDEHIVTALIGPNGAGKTTIFNLITGFLKPDKGEIKFRGQSIRDLPAYKIVRLGISRTFQNLRIFNKLTVKENILIGNQMMVGENVFDVFFRNSLSARKMKLYNQRAEEVMEFINLTDKANEVAENLSFAELKLLSLARTLITQPDLILLDEPASGLDPHSLDKILPLLKRLTSQGKTVLIIEHNLDVIRSTADHVCFLSAGGVMSKQGTCKEILEDEQLIDEYLGVTQ
jgi:ABC-type branched-subunit amino acid transport system ATPase component